MLLGRASPRSDIKIVESLSKILPCDKIIPRYITEFRAYSIMRKFFLDHEQYTHLVLATDDIVVKPKHIIQLKKDLEEFDYPVLTGMMNVDQRDIVNLNITRKLPEKPRRLRIWKWITRSTLPQENIFRVAFTGFALAAIKREIVKDYIFAADRVFEGLGPERGASLDFVFAWHCKEHNIPIYCDKRIDMKHLRTESKLKLNNPDCLFFQKGIGESISLDPTSI